MKGLEKSSKNPDVKNPKMDPRNKNNLNFKNQTWLWSCFGFFGGRG